MPETAIARRVEPTEIERELQRSYIDYAMSVIVGRALPDVRDGLKPVHRRILYSMWESGLRPDRPYRKCAAAVGEVIKTYHPHGDAPVYDALVRMAQDFNLRYPLVDGHGNFGSVDGDPPAAMRYTEARLSRMAMEMLRDIEAETVDFAPNYDGTAREPLVLPARFPNLLANGSAGIAVGMATNIPPHNLGELVDACVALLENPELGVEEIMRYVKGPDFPTGGVIMGRAGIQEAYAAGKGSITVRGRASVEEQGGRVRLVITELPYQVNKARLAERIQSLAEEGRLRDVTQVRDESNREGIRLVVELRRGADPHVVLNQLYKHTQLQENFGVIMLALVDGVPKLLDLPSLLRLYLAHQVEVVSRRTRFQLRKAEERAHVLEGLLVALEHLDQVIALIKASSSAEEAKAGLVSGFGLTEVQAQAILEMQLRRLARLERERIALEHSELMETIARLREILADPARVRGIVREELLEVKRVYGDARRTQILAEEGSFEPLDLVAEEDVVVTLTRTGYIKRIPLAAYRRQGRGGRGVRGVSLRAEDLLAGAVVCSTHDTLLFLTRGGRAYRARVYELPEAPRQSRGVFVANVPGLSFAGEDDVAALVAVRGFEEGKFLVLATRHGLVKRLPLEALASGRQGVAVASLREGDGLVVAAVSSGSDELLLVSREGFAFRVSEEEIRPMGRLAAGVKGMSLGRGDELLCLAVVRPESDVLLVTEEGLAKRTPLEAFPRHGRGARGVWALRKTARRGKLAGALVVGEEDEVLVATTDGTVLRTRVGEIPRQGRMALGARLVRLPEGARVAAVSLAGGEE